MRRRLKELLRLAELREDEVTLYLLLLKERQASIPKLIEKSGLNTMSAYRSIERLCERGLLKEVPLNDKQSLYEPLSLKHLIAKITAEEKKLKRLELALRNLDCLLPFMDLESDEESDELVEVREGRDAFREEYLKFPDCCNEEYLHIGNMHNYWNAANMTYECAEERAFINKRINRNIHCRIINTASKNAEEFQHNDSREKRVTRLSERIPIKDNYLGIAQTHAAHFICDAENPRVIVIKQPELLGMYKGQFEAMWKAGV
jgi:sugar-specific transcriptional regulator TrmB